MVNSLFFGSLALQLSLQAFIAPTKAASQCYYPNGDTAGGDTPCYTDGRITHCCGSNSICLTNQLCLSVVQPFSLSRGSCTDQSWGSSCPSYCKSAQPGAGAALQWYTNGTKATGDEKEYCCNAVVVSNNGTLVCSKIAENWQFPFSIADGSIIPDVAALDGLVRESTTAGSPTIANNTGNDDVAKQSDSAMTNDFKKNVSIGAGVGVPLGVIALLSIGWALYERRLRKMAASARVPAGGYGYASERISSRSEPAELIAWDRKPVELYESSRRGSRF